MENLSSSWNNANLNDPKYRMATRPQQQPSSTSRKDSRQQTGGRAAENHGSDFARGAAQRKANAATAQSKSRATMVIDSDSDSTDPLDSLPPSRTTSRAGSEIEIVDEKNKDEKDGYVDEKGIHHPYNPAFQKTNMPKGLKFKKNKVPALNGNQQPDVSSSRFPVLKDHGNEHDSAYRRPILLPTPSQPNAHHNRSPPRRRSPSPARRPIAPPPPADIPSESIRPKPRRVHLNASSTRKPQESAHPSPIPHSTASRMTVSGSPFHSTSNRTPPRSSENFDTGKQSTIKKPEPSEFPLPSPVRAPAKFPSIDSLDPDIKSSHLKKSKAADFPSLSPCRAPAEFPLDVLGSPEVVAVKKPPPAKRSVSEKIASIKPPPPCQEDDKVSAETRTRKRLGPGHATKSRRRVVESEESEEEEAMPKAQPFPMSTQMLDSIGSSPSFAGPSNLKRSSSNSYEEPDSKRLREDDFDFSISVDYDGTVEEDIDPNTLCPYCDARLPSQPTPQLLHLLASAEKKSYREPRAKNRLGRTAPFTVYIAACQRHQFENDMLPEAERMGWPKTIDWTRLGKRVKKMERVLRAIIDDSGSIDSDNDDLFNGKGKDISRPRERCVFWKEAMEEIKKKGTRAAAGIRGQFASFEKLQPGYYGEMGSVIIHQTLYDLFPPASIGPDLVSPLTANEFLQRIMVPEIAARLIMQDMDLDESRMDDAVKILRESANYGVAMFPADEGDGGGDEEELGAADMILMKRAMTRRKELDADEKGEEEEYVRLMAEQEKEEKERLEREREKRLRKRGKEKAKEADNMASSSQVTKTRPKPRPLGKSASSASMADVGIPSSSLEYSGTDVEDVPRHPQNRPKPSCLPSQSWVESSEEKEPSSPKESSWRKARPFPSLSPSRSKADVGDGSPPNPKSQQKPVPLPAPRKTKHLGTLDTDATPRKPSARALTASSPLDITSSDDPTDDEWDLGRMKKKNRDRKTHSVATDDDNEAGEPVPPSSSFLISPFRERPITKDSEEETPKPHRALAHETPDYYDAIPPLERARRRKNKFTSTHNREKESHSWLLSDNSHSSFGSSQ